jgi:hypothetical protein
MAVFNSLVFLLSLFAASNALATPHVVRHHRAIAARVALPAPLDLPLVPLRKRQNSKRCKQRSSAVNPLSSDPAVSSTPVVVKPTTTPTKPPPTTPTPSPSTTYAPAPKPTTTQRSSGGSTGGSSSNLPSFMVGTQTGQGTFYSSVFFFSSNFLFLTNARQLAWVHAVSQTKIPTTLPRYPTYYLTTSRMFQRSLFPAIKSLIVLLPSVVTRLATPITTPCVAEE